MEFNEKLQELRKKKGLTQEELAESLYVSRTAVSKWESGRGYPSIDSLKAIAKFFSVTVDSLLSGDELLSIAEEDSRQKENHFRNLVFGMLDLSVSMLLFLPFFAQRSEGIIREVSLLNLSEVEVYMKVLYAVFVTAITSSGILTLVFRDGKNFSFWNRNKNKISLTLNVLGTLLFILSLQPYAAVFLFVFLTIKVLVLIKWQ